ncbi:MAG: DUF58 domain-containing protein, partial [bacterium]
MIPNDLMNQLRYIEVYTRRAVRDHRVGDTRSPIRGRGFEFDQHKRYQHGDDYRQIDWNVTARMRHPYVKKDYEEKELSAIIVADLSRSMEFASVPQSKRDLLVQVAAILAFSAASDNMQVGLLGFTDVIELELPLRKGPGQTWKIMEALWDTEPGSKRTNFLVPLEHLDTKLKTSTLLFFISDFINTETVFDSRALKHLAQKHDLVPMIIEDGWEQAMPEGRGFLRLQDAEMGGAMTLNLSRKTRDLYASLMRERRAVLERSLYNLNLDHLFLRAGYPYLDTVTG